jgi:hypothetical protein
MSRGEVVVAGGTGGGLDRLLGSLGVHLVQREGPEMFAMAFYTTAPGLEVSYDLRPAVFAAGAGIFTGGSGVFEPELGPGTPPSVLGSCPCSC